jgi:GNAT superfamily N-acetyltransferase
VIHCTFGKLDICSRTPLELSVKITKSRLPRPSPPKLIPPLILTLLAELLELVTSPSYRRLGLGTRLINIGLSRADQEGIPCYLSGAPMGVPVYKKAGFVDIGRISIGLEEFGGEGTHVHVAMVREPKV